MRYNYKTTYAQIKHTLSLCEMKNNKAAVRDLLRFFFVALRPNAGNGLLILEVF
jgi:hypothetical protein